MDRLHNREGVLLMLAYSMHQDNLITYEEKGHLKGKRPSILDYIIDGDDCLNGIYEEYLQSGTILTLGTKIIGLIRSASMKIFIQESSE